MTQKLSIVVLGVLAYAQTQPSFRPYNYDESKIGSYTLPSPLILGNGKPVKDKETWNRIRRPELFHLFETEMFGRTPPPPPSVAWSHLAVDSAALGGKAMRKQLTMTLRAHPDGPQVHLLLYLPTGKKSVPVFLGLNFSGNQAVINDPGIDLHDVWIRGKKQPATEASRGTQTQQWQIEKILGAGYGLATIYYSEIEPDYVGGIKEGVRPFFFSKGQTEPAPDEWGAIGAWAWGLSRALDYLETDADVDARHVAVMGHSRLGKTAVWAGASDPRFAMVISNNSGEGGAAISKRDYGETIEHLNVAFPHWFCGNYKKYTNHPENLPFDANELLALVAPRPLYIASAEDDKGSDPKENSWERSGPGRCISYSGRRA